MALIKISFFKKANDTTPVDNIEVNEALEAIKQGAIKGRSFVNVVSQIRSNTDKGKQTDLKKGLPCVTWAGTFDKRNSIALQVYSQLICHDIDKVGIDQAQHLKSNLSKNPYVYACFISPSGAGLKVLFRVATGHELHDDTFTAIGVCLNKGYGIKYDTTSRDISRLCFLSHDQDIYINPGADIIPESLLKEYRPVEPVKPTVKKALYTGLVNDKYTDVEHCISQIEARKIDVAPVYEDWCKIGFALSDEFGEAGRDFFHRVSAYYPGYNYQVADKQYTQCLKGKGTNKVKIASFFDLCKRSGIDTKSPKKTPIKQEKNTKNTPEKLKKNNENSTGSGFDENRGVGDGTLSKGFTIADLYKIHRHGDGRFKDIVIIQHKFNNLLYSFGFRRYDIDLNSWVFVKLEKNIIRRVSITTIQDEFFKYLKSLPEKLNDDLSREILIEKFTRGRETYFSTGNLSLLRNDRDFNLCTDTKDASFIFFKNGFVKCTSGNIELMTYDKMDGYIWNGQMIEKDFEVMQLNETDIENSGMYAKFIYNVCQQKRERMKSLCTIIGYSLHTYYENKLKAMIFTDSEITETPNGRTGKTLLLQSLKKIKPTVLINGKDFKADHQFKYQDVELDTQIVALNDIKTNLRVEDLFNDITEGIRVEKKNQKPFTNKVKFLIATNRTLKIEGASAKDRVVEFEFSNYYSDKFSPAEEFKVWFFVGWENKEWNSFYNFMAYCVSTYLQYGLITPETINADRRRLYEHTHEDFVNWMDDMISDKKVIPGNEYEKSELHNIFLNTYPEHREKKGGLSASRTFTTALKFYVNHSGHFAPYKADDERRSNGKGYIRLRALNDNFDQPGSSADTLPF